MNVLFLERKPKPGPRDPGTVPVISNDVMWYMLHCNVQMPLNLQWSHILRNSLCLTYWTSWPIRSTLESICPLSLWSCCWFGATNHCHCPLCHNSITLHPTSLKKRLKFAVRFLLHRYLFCTIFLVDISWKWGTARVCLSLLWVLWQTASD